MRTLFSRSTRWRPLRRQRPGRTRRPTSKRRSSARSSRSWRCKMRIRNCRPACVHRCVSAGQSRDQCAHSSRLLLRPRSSESRRYVVSSLNRPKKPFASRSSRSMTLHLFNRHLSQALPLSLLRLRRLRRLHYRPPSPSSRLRHRSSRRCPRQRSATPSQCARRVERQTAADRPHRPSVGSASRRPSRRSSPSFRQTTRPRPTR